MSLFLLSNNCVYVSPELRVAVFQRVWGMKTEAEERQRILSVGGPCFDSSCPSSFLSKSI